ncbi:MAG: hypothetical protein WBR18_10095 [Anaerolineales bacterium]
MSRIEWTEVLIKLLIGHQLFEIISTGPYLLAAIYSFALESGYGTQRSTTYLALIFLIALPLVIAAFLWNRVSKLARCLWRSREALKIDSERSEGEPGTQLSQVVPALLGGLGLYITLSSLPGAVSSLGNLFFTWDEYQGIGLVSALGLSDAFVFTSYLLVLGIGLLLVIRPARISHILVKLWNPYEAD